MNRNTLLLIAAGVGAYLVWKHLQKKAAVDGIGQTVDWTRLPMPGMSLGTDQSWVDESIRPPAPASWMRSGRLAGFNSVEDIGQAEFGCGLGFMPQFNPSSLQVHGSASFQGQIDPSASPIFQSGGMPTGGRLSPRAAPMLPSLATGTYDYGRGRSLTPDESRAQARTASGWGGTGRPGSGGAPRSTSMLPRLDAGAWAPPAAEAQFQQAPARSHSKSIPMTPANMPHGSSKSIPMTPANIPHGYAPAQGAMPSSGSDSWGGDAGTSMDMIPNVL